MTHDLSTALDDLATAEYADAPASTIDIGRARADGRRRMLTTRLAPIGGGVAVVAACALVVNGLGGASAAKPTVAAAAAGGAAGQHAFTGTDPVAEVATFGWLPAGYQAANTTSGADYGDSVTARTKDASSTTPTTPSMVTLEKSASLPPLSGGATRKPVTVPGSPKAYLMTIPADDRAIDEPELALQWQTASGFWFTISDYAGAKGSALEAALIKIAGSVAPSDAAVALPIHIEGLPKGLTLGSAYLDDPVTIGQDGFSVAMSYHTGTKPGTGHYFNINVQPTDQQDPAHSTGPKGVLNAYDPAHGTVGSSGTCKDSNGLHICVQDDPSQAGADPLAPIGGAQGLLDRITSLGTDPANWTTKVIN